MPNDQLLATQVCMQARCPVFLWGAPGIGKSINLEEIARALGEPLHTVILSIREPSDQGGIPVVRPDSVHMHPPRWAHELCAKGHGVVFWDEFNTAAPTNQSSALRVIHEGWAGDLKLPYETSHVAAGNPASMVSGGYDLTAAIANRWTHLNWPVDHEAWTTGMVAGWPPADVVRLPKEWRDLEASKRGVLSAFIKRKPNLLLAVPQGASAQGGAWPSPRMWSRVATLLAASDSVAHNVKSSVARLLVLGCVGDGATTEFIEWITNLDLRDPEEYLAKPLDTPLPTRQDQIMATLDSVAAAALDRTKKDYVERYYRAWRVAGRLLKTKGDIAIPACRTLAGNIPKEVRKSLPPEVEEILPLLEKAGIDFSNAA